MIAVFWAWVWEWLPPPCFGKVVLFATTSTYFYHMLFHMCSGPIRCNGSKWVEIFLNSLCTHSGSVPVFFKCCKHARVEISSIRIALLLLFSMAMACVWAILREMFETCNSLRVNLIDQQQATIWSHIMLSIWPSNSQVLAFVHSCVCREWIPSCYNWMHWQSLYLLKTTLLQVKK